MKVRHRTRRRGHGGDSGTILVGGARYTIDENGCVDVSDEHGAMMLQGAQWIRVAAASHPKNDPEREELLAKADDLGVKVDRRLSKTKLASAIEAKKEKTS